MGHALTHHDTVGVQKHCGAHGGVEQQRQEGQAQGPQLRRPEQPRVQQLVEDEEDEKQDDGDLVESGDGNRKNSSNGLRV